MLYSFVAVGIRTSGYWPAKMAAAERLRHNLRLLAVAPACFAIAWLFISAGALLISHYNWWAFALVAFFGLTQVALVNSSRRRARRRAAGQQAKAAP